MVRPEKTAIVAEVEDRLGQAEGVIVTEYSGLSVKQFQTLREGLGHDVEYKIFKNTLVRIAASNHGLDGFESYLRGAVGLVFCHEDPVSVLKKLKDFAADMKPLKITGAILEDAVVDGAHVKKLADLPSRDELLAMVVGSVRSPLSKLVGVVGNPMTGLIGTLQAVVEEKEAGQSAG